MNALQKRLDKLEQKKAGPAAIIVVWNETRPDVYQVQGQEYPSLEAVKAAHPGQDMHVLEVVYSKG